MKNYYSSLKTNLQEKKSNILSLRSCFNRIAIMIAVLVSLLSFSLNAQTVTIGAGTTTQIYPLGNYYGFERSASIYTAAEIGTTGNITTVSWYANDAGKGSRPIVIYMKTIAATTLGTTTWATETSGSINVYSGNITPVVGWNTITLATAFNYTGGNLEVLVEANFGGGGNSGGTTGNNIRYSTAASKHAYWRQDNSAPTGNGTVSSNRPNIQLGITPLTPCSGTPAPGNTNASVTSLVSGATTNLSLQNPTIGSGVSYQWQSSASSSGPWNNIVGATSSNYTATVTANTYYQCIVTCSGTSGTSNPILISLTYCTPAPTSVDGSGITRVVFGTGPTVNNSTGSEAGNYGNYAAQIGGQYQGSTCNVDITFSTGYTYGTAIWVDWNDDLVFDATELVYTGTSTGTNPTTLNASFTVPLTATVGNHRIRIGSADSGTLIPCYTGSYASYEDYTLQVIALAACSGTPNAGTASISSPSGCVPSSVTLATTGLTIGTGISYQWQSSPSAGGPWSNISGATSATYIASPSAGTTYYRLMTTCSNGATSNNSNVVSYAGITCASNSVPASASTTIACGTNTMLYDSGGASGNYANSSNGYTVLENSGTGVITLSGTSIGEACCDYIRIFEGNGISGTQIGQYNMGTPIPVITSASGQSITVQFISDGSINGAGFEIQVIYTGVCSSCIPPTALTLNSTTTSGATLSWTAPASAPSLGYQYYYSTSATAPTTSTTPSGSTAAGVTSVSLTGLTTNTTYYFWVRSNCGVETSSWVGSTSFYTGYCSPSPTSVDNSGITNVTFGIGPVVNNTTATEPGNYGNYSSQIGGVTQGTTLTVNITYSTSYTYGTKIWVDWNDDLIFTDATELMYTGLSASNNPTTLVATFVVPSTATPGNHRIRIGGTDNDSGPTNACYSGGYGTFEDYTLFVISPCVAIINSVSATTVCGTGTSDISATGNASTTIISLYNSATGGTAITSISGNSGTLTSPSISSNTTYYVEASNGTCQSIRIPVNVVANPKPTAVTASTSIASMCNGGTVDLTSSAVSNSDVNLNYTESFEGGLPSDWLIVNAGTGNNWTVPTTSYPTPPTGITALEYRWNGSSPANSWAFTPSFNLVAGVTYTVSSRYASTGATFPEAFKVTVGNSQTVAGQTITLQDFPSVTNSTFATQSATYTPSISGLYYFAWNCYSSANQFYLDIDDISITGSAPQPATFAWTSATAGFTSSIQNPTNVPTTVTTTYTVEATNGYGCTETNSVVVTVINPTATITSTSSTICHGNTVALTGTVTIPNSVVNIDNGVGAVTAVGTNWSINVSPTVTTTYSITSVTSGGCTGTGTGSTTFTLPTLGADISTNGTKTCAVTENNWVNFYDASGLLIGAINSGGLNLGNVSIEVASNTAGYMNDCIASTNPLYSTAYMGKSWIVKSSLYNGTDFPALSNVSVRLPYSSTNLSAMNTVASTQTTGNPNDDGATAATLMLTKHTAAVENHNPLDNCLSGTTRGIAQSGNGVTTTTYPGLTSATGSDYVEFKVLQFSEMFLNKNFNNSPLPVKLTSFSATCENNVTLSWTTASEQNSDRFIVEKSRDGQTWSIVGEQAAAGNSNTILNYNFTDANSWNATSYYRLRQIDFNGAEEIYGAISVTCENKESSMTVYPNPNSGSFTIEIASTEMYTDAQLILTDLTGKTIASQKVNVANGTTQILINDLDLKMGTYLVTLRGADQQLKPVKVMVTR